MDADRFRTEHLPHIRSNSTLRNHISALIDAGCIRKVHQGAGPRNGPGRRRRGRAGFTQYFIDAPGITPDLPYQYRMPMLVLMTPADELPSLFVEWDRSRSADGQESQAALSVRKQDETRRDLSENQTSFGSHKEGNKKKKEQSMHAGMPGEWTELFIGQCARRSGLTGLRPLHLQERPRSRNGPIPSVYESVSAYIERQGRAPPEDIAGWLADELHYTLKYDPSWQDGGHNSPSRLVAFISTVVARQLERDELGGLYFDPTKGAPETSGHRHQPVESSAVQPIRRSL